MSPSWGSKRMFLPAGLRRLKRGVVYYKRGRSEMTIYCVTYDEELGIKKQQPAPFS